MCVRQPLEVVVGTLSRHVHADSSNAAIHFVIGNFWWQVTIHRDMLKAQVKGADDERQQISSELHERISRIDKLRKRFVSLFFSFRPKSIIFEPLCYFAERK